MQCIEEGRLGKGLKLFNVIKHVTEMKGEDGEMPSEDQIFEAIKEKFGGKIHDEEGNDDEEKDLGEILQGAVLKMCEEYQISHEHLEWLEEKIDELGGGASEKALAIFTGEETVANAMPIYEDWKQKCVNSW